MRMGFHKVFLIFGGVHHLIQVRYKGIRLRVWMPVVTLVGLFVAGVMVGSNERVAGGVVHGLIYYRYEFYN